jgi:hypothetical protein
MTLSPSLQRDARWFDESWYLATYPDVAQAGVAPLQHYLECGQEEGRLPRRLTAVEWEKTLWQKVQLRKRMLDYLTNALAQDQGMNASYAGFALARWHAWQGDWHAAAECLARRRRHQPALPNHMGPGLLEVEALTRIGSLAAAWQQLGALFARAPASADACLAAANLLARQAEWYEEADAVFKAQWHDQRLAWLNQVWQGAGLMPVTLNQPERPLSIDNLVARRSPPVVKYGETVAEADSDTLPLVSVIVPVFNAEDGLSTALESLAAQTLAQRFTGALEIIVVDDASTDNSVIVAEAFAVCHSGVRVLCQPHNQGAYAARNRGLSAARGECLTIHDSDDWSHPQKLEKQWQALQEHPRWVACNSHWVRCTPELIFSRWRMETGWVYRNTSSLMFRRRVFETLGFWDRVRVEADTEYYHRIQAAYGAAALGEVLPGVPLSFGRAVANSLTAVGDTHLVTQFSGVRADYRKASQAWHAASSVQDLYLPAHPPARPFRVPFALLP